MPFLSCGKFRFSLDRPLIMGIVNVTPDSFSDGGVYASPAAALGHALRLMDEGADLLDIGGESTRPDAAPVTAEEESRRVLPLIEALQRRDIPLSVDTSKPEVMRRAIGAGASLINDVNALRAPGALEAVAASDVGVCLMHRRGDPASMQLAPYYEDVVGEVAAFLGARVKAACDAGLARERLLVDPGFGFGKNLVHNVELLRHLGRFDALGIPLLAGMSRKSMLGAITGRDVGGRLSAGIAAVVLAVLRGAKVVRVHDVGATRDALEVVRAIEGTQ
jgi:dihydropteroate synthase